MSNNFHDRNSLWDLWKSLLKEFLQTYINFFSWLFNLFFPERKTKESISVFFNIETLRALIDNLSPKPFDQEVKNGAQSFFLSGNDNIGILMIHGFGSSPAEFRELADLLYEEKHYTINAVRLSGHGTSVSDQSMSNFLDWYYSVLEGYDQLKEYGCKSIFVIGHSMGGTLALLLASTRKINAIVSLCAPLELGNFYHGLPIPLLKYVAQFIRRWPRRKESIALQKKIGAPVYEHHSLNAVVEMFDLLEITKEEISKVEAPILTIGAEKDYHVPLSNQELLGDLVNSKEIIKFIATQSGHTILLDKEKDLIFKKIMNFLIKLEQKNAKGNVKKNG